MNKSIVAIYVLMSLLVVSCRKAKSDFVLEKYEYVQGETLLIDNLNPKKNQIWAIYDSENTLICC